MASAVTTDWKREGTSRPPPLAPSLIRRPIPADVAVPSRLSYKKHKKICQILKFWNTFKFKTSTQPINRAKSSVRMQMRCKFEGSRPCNSCNEIQTKIQRINRLGRQFQENRFMQQPVESAGDKTEQRADEMNEPVT